LASAASFTLLGHLPGGDLGSRAYAVSADGNVVAGWCGTLLPSPNSLPQPFRWTPEEGMKLLDIEGVYGYVNGMSADGNILVGNTSDGIGISSAFRWTTEVGFQRMNGVPTDVFSYATGVSFDGSAVVGGIQYSSAPSTGKYEAFLWRSDVGIDFVGEGSGTYFDGWAISGNGTVITGHGHNGHHAFRWNSTEGLTSLNNSLYGFQYSVGNAISADGSVVVGYALIPSENYFHPIRWGADGTVTLLQVPADPEGIVVRAISADGARTIGSTTLGASIWDPDGLHSLKDVLISEGIDLAGWSPAEALAISPNGRFIVGTATNPSGVTEAFLAELPAPIPEPSTLSLAISGVVLVLGVAKFKRQRTGETVRSDDLSRLSYPGDTSARFCQHTYHSYRKGSDSCGWLTSPRYSTDTCYTRQ
jgi:uncharacterized membrane protein